MLRASGRRASNRRWVIEAKAVISISRAKSRRHTNSALVPGVADPGDRAGRRHLGHSVLRLERRCKFRCHAGTQRQRRSHPGEQALNLVGVVDHATSANSTVLFGCQCHGGSVCNSWTLVRPETMRSSTSSQPSHWSIQLSFVVWISVIAIAQ